MPVLRWNLFRANEKINAIKRRRSLAEEILRLDLVPSNVADGQYCIVYSEKLS